MTDSGDYFIVQVHTAVLTYLQPDAEYATAVLRHWWYSVAVTSKAVWQAPHCHCQLTVLSECLEYAALLLSASTYCQSNKLYIFKDINYWLACRKPNCKNTKNIWQIFYHLLQCHLTQPLSQKIITDERRRDNI